MSPVDGAKLKELRLKKRLTQGALAEKAGTYQPRIAELENGKRPVTITVDTLERIAKALGVSVRRLLT
jgi:transcriptional regulator with XRE-family HTH domain